MRHILIYAPRMASHWVCNPVSSSCYLQRLANTTRTMGIRRKPGWTTCLVLRAVREFLSCFTISHLTEPRNLDRTSTKPESEIQAEIRYILKQIVSTVTFLPIIDEPTVFNILAYTSESADVPADEWVDTDPLAIEAGKSQQVKLRSFSTDVHRIEAMVAYRYEG